MFYHASTVAGIRELLPMSATHDTARIPVVYLTPNRAYALFYIRDKEINGVSCGVGSDGIVRYDEQFPRQLSVFYQGMSGYIYGCADSDAFVQSATREVWTASFPVPVVSTETVHDVYEEITQCEKAGAVNIVRYETLAEEKKQEYRDMMVYNIFKNDWLQVAHQARKAAFVREYFPDAWALAQAHPERKRQVMEEWEKRLRK